MYFERPEPGAASTPSGQLSATEPSGFGVAVTGPSDGATVSYVTVIELDISPAVPLFRACTEYRCAPCAPTVVSSKLVVAGSVIGGNATPSRKTCQLVTANVTGGSHVRCGTAFVGELAESWRGWVALGGVTSTLTEALAVLPAASVAV